MRRWLSILLLFMVPVALVAQRAAVIRAYPPPSRGQPQLIASLEQQLAANPSDLEIRARLLNIYAASNPGPDGELYRIGRLAQIRYLVTEAPASSLAGSPVAFVASAGAPYGNPQDHAAIAALWIAQANSHFSDPKVVLNATRFLAVEDRPRAETLFANTLASMPDNVEIAARLGFFYAACLVGRDTAETAHCRNALDHATSPHVLMGASIALPNLAMRSTGGGPAFEDWVRYSESLRGRASGIDPMAAGTHGMPVEFQMFATESESTRPPSADQLADQMAQQAAQPPDLLSSPAPVYPPQAASAGIEGVVRLKVRIGPDGKLNSAQLISGPPLLVTSALEAVQTWTWKPVSVNGTAVSVSTTVEVPFQLPAAH
jgi:TonB family protein